MKPDFEKWAREVVEYNDNPEADWPAVCVALKYEEDPRSD